MENNQEIYPEFDDIIGYEDIKAKLYETLSAIKEPGRFKSMGISSPRGLLLYGNPGVGKTVLAEAFIKASGRKVYAAVQRGDKRELMEHLSNLFQEAKTNVPSIVFLDDIDKYAGGQEDAVVYGVLQSLIDSVKDEEVFVIATVNSFCHLPNSLVREGRFDQLIEISEPSKEDAALLIKEFLENKPHENINYDDVEAIASFSSCVEIKTSINQAAIKAAYAGRTAITMEDFVNVFMLPNAKRYSEIWMPMEDMKEEVAIHEAGHALAYEACVPGSVAFVSIVTEEDMSGFTRLRKTIARRPYSILGALGGKAAVEMKSGKLASGCGSDLSTTYGDIFGGMTESASCGFGLFAANASETRSWVPTDEQKAVIGEEFERYLRIDKTLVVNNMAFLDELSALLLKKGYVLASELAAIKEKHPLNTECIKGI